ncbi:MAG TPA: OmpA family protein [Pseudomonadota bacterium]|nr:OmpA family protein [Pseudomonadota bacterium]
MHISRLQLTVTLTAALGLYPALGRADFLDTVKSVAEKPEVQNAAKQVGNKAVEASKGAAGKSITGKLEKEINTRLLDEARKNQCSFKSDSDALEPGCDGKAKKLANTILDAKKKLAGAGINGFKFEVSGHTDTRGNAAHNKELSARRAAVMVKQLVAQGVPAGDIISVGMGAEQPLVKPDDTPAKQAKNRRYELRVRL